MVFSSLLFLFVYLPIVLLVYYLAPGRVRMGWLFVVNLVFYAWGEPVYVFLMLLSIGVNYAAGLLVGRYRDDKRRARWILAGNAIVNIGLLFFFKYSALFVRTLNALPYLQLPVPEVALPIGISFYTFQGMSYPIDVYRNDAEPQRNFIRFGTFVALFPQLIAGPIVRYKDLAWQFEADRRSAESFASGIGRFALGLGKKVLLANNIGLLWDCYASASASSLSFVGAWLGTIAFSLQIYFDFSGYSDMAIGLGRMLGFEFMENFRFPYAASSITEFWRRWHISLGTWFRDYVYIPLGGNRCGLQKQLMNILIVWALTGLWHGASWTFLIWGLYHAFFLLLEKTFLLRLLDKLPRFVRHLYTLVVVFTGWVVFQQDSLSQTAVFWRAMFGFGRAGLMNSTDLYRLGAYGLLLLVGAIVSLPWLRNRYERLSSRWKRILCPVGTVLLIVFSTCYLVDGSYNPFLYFRF